MEENADITVAGCGLAEAKQVEMTAEEKPAPAPVIKKKKKVAIVGCADSKDSAPFGDKSFEIWGVNNLFYHIPRWNRWFEIHPIGKDAEGKWTRRWSTDFRGQSVEHYLRDIGRMPVPCMMQKRWPEIPNSVEYPLQEVIAKFGRYFTNTISYQLALAIHEKYEVIHLYGVDMAVGGEYTNQRASCEYFLGIIVGMGIELYIPPEADLLKTRFLYAFEEKEIDLWMKKVNKIRKSMQERLQQSKMTLEKEQQRFQQYIGGLETVNEMDKIWSEVRDTESMFRGKQ